MKFCYAKILGFVVLSCVDVLLVTPTTPPDERGRWTWGPGETLRSGEPSDRRTRDRPALSQVTHRKLTAPIPFSNRNEAERLSSKEESSKSSLHRQVKQYRSTPDLLSINRVTHTGEAILGAVPILSGIVPIVDPLARPLIPKRSRETDRANNFEGRIKGMGKFW